ncbi:hypothetical protein CFK37_17865 [Virgibacillus phasianinus]|uniref:DUF4083 domain-containing protein n=1 Tax=Virgibacillus phasianinus TaxID=2017483 RepID=A0A220U7Q6_9BACI|nr:hypothetical protein [Virgibacillus phasianinus]ASK63891.1 hypothetical protein CFK37_17865 [Virgibacillus phasianinus]
MFLMSAGGLLIGDIIFQVVLLLVVITIVVGVTLLFNTINKKNNRLNRLEEKVDKLLSDKEK